MHEYCYTTSFSNSEGLVVIWCRFVHSHFHVYMLYHRSDFPDIIGYVQPIGDVILSEENVQVSYYLQTILS